MGLDVYLNWNGQTETEKAKQFQGFDITIGKFGYLRGAYNGHIGLKAINVLFAGVNQNKTWKVQPELLKKNLAILEKTLFKTHKKEFHKDEPQSYRDFVALAEKQFQEGKKPIIRFSG